MQRLLTAVGAGLLACLLGGATRADQIVVDLTRANLPGSRLAHTLPVTFLAKNGLPVGDLAAALGSPPLKPVLEADQALNAMGVRSCTPNAFVSCPEDSAMAGLAAANATTQGAGGPEMDLELILVNATVDLIDHLPFAAMVEPAGWYQGGVDQDF